MRRIHHEFGCLQRVFSTQPCTCAAIEDELVPGNLPTPGQPYQSLASMIRQARREGLLRPVQQYGGGHARTSAP